MNEELENLVANNQNLSHLSDAEMVDFCNKMNQLFESMTKDEIDSFSIMLTEYYTLNK